MRDDVEHGPGMPGERGPDRCPAASGRLRGLVCVTLLACLFAVAAPLPSGASEEQDDPVVNDPAVNDPLEPLNRVVFAINEALDTIILRPAAVVYGAVLPDEVRLGIRNVVRHLSLPFTFVNDVAQGEWTRSGETAQRFVINTMVGFAGLYDAAAKEGLPHRSTDFGSTLAVWGVGDGPYLVLPIAGPSSVRDAAGLVVESVTDPVDIAFRRADLDSMPLIRAGVAAVDFRHRNLDTLDDFKENSLDYYAFIRTLYRQRRAFELDTDGDRYLTGGMGESGEDYAYPPPRPDFGRSRPPAQ